MYKSNSIDSIDIEVLNYGEWLKNPISVGSIYVKPTEERKTYGERIYQYFWWICCFRCARTPKRRRSVGVRGLSGDGLASKDNVRT
jgi:hypothetical protein